MTTTDTRETSHAVELGLDELLSWHRGMVLSREIELHCTRKTGHWYPSIGEEATIVGTYSQLEDGDFASPHYRGALIIPWLRGRPLVDVMGCLDYTAESPTRGRLYGGFAGDVERLVLPYVTMVLGPSLAIAVGAAVSARYQGTDRVAVSSFGDGTSGTGDFHESLNLAATLQAPVVFVCQNNHFSISTSSARGLACDSVADWAAGYRMPAVSVDGNDVVAVANAVAEGIGRARAGGGPSFVEAVTYRRTGHFIADPAAYRDGAEAAAWEQRDPILALERILLDRGVTPDDIALVWKRTQDDVVAAAEEAAAKQPLSADDLGVGGAYGIVG